jgi:hypothetical protein
MPPAPEPISRRALLATGAAAAILPVLPAAAQKAPAPLVRIDVAAQPARVTGLRKTRMARPASAGAQFLRATGGSREL